MAARTTVNVSIDVVHTTEDDDEDGMMQPKALSSEPIRRQADSSIQDEDEGMAQSKHAYGGVARCPRDRRETMT